MDPMNSLRGDAESLCQTTLLLITTLRIQQIHINELPHEGELALLTEIVLVGTH